LTHVVIDAPLYPVGLIVTGRRVLVVGGGKVAADKVRNLVTCGADVTVVAPDVDDAITSLDGVTVERRAYERGDAGSGYRLVIAATDDAAVNRQVHDDAEAAGVWVNAADDPVNCTFTLPAVLRRGRVTVGVATGGSSPALAAWLRDRIATAEVGPEYEVLADLLAEARARQPRRDWRNILDSGILDDIRAGRIAEARERLQL
jgi:precorrin-2 dehydrogenase/sirohydrochlorin ferrochelatase